MFDEIKRGLEVLYDQALANGKLSFQRNGDNSPTGNYFYGQADAYHRAIVMISEEERKA